MDVSDGCDDAVKRREEKMEELSGNSLECFDGICYFVQYLVTNASADDYLSRSFRCSEVTATRPRYSFLQLILLASCAA